MFSGLDIVISMVVLAVLTLAYVLVKGAAKLWDM